MITRVSIGIISLFSIGWVILVLNWFPIPVDLTSLIKEIFIATIPVVGMWWIDNLSRQRGIDDQKARAENDKKTARGCY
jgi:hypothetical protein